MIEKGIIMKEVLTAVLGVGLFLGVCSAGEKPTLNDIKDKDSYSIGYQFGTLIKSQGVDYDLEVLVAGIRDAFGGKKPQLNEEEMKTVLNDLQKKIWVARQRQLKEQAAKNLSEGKAFLDENSKKEGVKTLPSGLQYKIIREGTGASPKESDTVTVHYRGTLIEGTEFDNSFKRGNPETFQVNGVIPGWTEALQLMKEGAKWQIFVPSELAYGERGQGSRIPPNSTLIFEVELISINQGQTDKDGS